MPTLPDPPEGQSGPPPAPDAEGGGPPAVFTVAGANRLLPYLRSALTDARAHHGAMRRCEDELRKLEAVGRAPSGAWILAADHRAASARLIEHQQACQRILAQIAARGCQVKDLATGLCDFPALVGGEPVLLCWRMEEPAVAHYHGHLEGFRGRRPIPPHTP